jgi:putative transposase
LTVKRILDRNGMEPAPKRRRKTSWRTFLTTHWDLLAAGDFFTVEVLRWAGLVRYHVIFFIELKTRRMHVAGIAHEPGEEWMKQIARNLTDASRGFLNGMKYVIIDCDALFSAVFRRIQADCGVSVVRLPARSPNLNAYAERRMKSMKSECLSRFVALGESHLRRAVTSYILHYHAERNHQSLESRTLEPEPGVGSLDGPIERRMRLGGLLNYYYRRAG